jgi:Predicted thioesterase
MTDREVPTDTSVITYMGVAHPWLCDTMGHMNVRHYAAMFDDASFQLLGMVSGPDEPGKGWADIRCEIDYKHETRAGTLLTIRSHIVALGRSSITYAHTMTGTLDGVVHAQAKVVSVRFDLERRVKMDIEDDVRQSARELTPGLE